MTRIAFNPALAPSTTVTASTDTSPPADIWRMLSAPQNPPPMLRGLDAFWAAIEGKIRNRLPRTRQLLRRAEAVQKRAEAMEALGARAFAAEAERLHEVFRRGRNRTTDIDEAFAVIREAVRREKGLRLHREQIAAGLGLHQGYLIELATGEGKTLVATLPAILAGWRGRGCHVLTVNDYLARRDAEEMGPVYRACGLKVACIQEAMEPPHRRAAYAADVTYVTNKEVAADFLRDRLSLGSQRHLPAALLAGLAAERRGGSVIDRVVMRGLQAAVVDEADSILIDDAVTPLILSGADPNAARHQAIAEAAELADRLSAGEHYRVNQQWREVNLTERGRSELAELCRERGGFWAGARRREEMVVQALTARHLFLRDRHYVVKEGKVVIIDESTGRLMPDRTWRDGLHQAVEAKEKLEIQPLKQTLSRVSFQRFFRMYKHLCGMTGTAREAGDEFWQIYRMPVVRIPTHRPCRRVQAPDRLYRDASERWEAAVAEIRDLHRQGRPVLVGTRSVQASELLSGKLKEAGIEHQVLNAVRHEEEAQIVARAGQPGQVTVATNMAGRGTDIRLGRGVAEVGGLHVLATERHDTSRIDRQLFGRAGRQGDPGSAQVIMSLEDELFVRHTPKWLRLLLGGVKRAGALSGWRVRSLVSLAQKRAERAAFAQRKGVLRTDTWLEEQMAFARPEA